MCRHVQLRFSWAANYESGGREFESFPVRHLNQPLSQSVAAAENHPGKHMANIFALLSDPVSGL